MPEEKKEEKKIEGEKEEGKEKVQAKAEAPQAPAAPSENVKAEEEKKKPVTEKKTKEKPANCASCNKSIKKKRWYYRNGKYYCTKRCWKATLKKQDADAKVGTPSQ